MMKKSSIKYLILVLFLIYISAVPTDILDLNHSRWETFCGVSVLLFFIATMITAFIMFLDDSYEDELFFDDLFGEGKSYSFIFTFMLIPAILYGFFIAEDGSLYGSIGLVLFLFYEYIRTIQNSFAQDIKDKQLREEATRKQNPPKEVVIK